MADFTTNTNVNTSTMEHLVGKTVDTILNYSPITMLLLGNQKKWIGSQERLPIKYQTSSQGVSFDGLQHFSTTKSSNFVNMTFSPTGREMPVVISQIEVDINETNKVIDLLKRQMLSDAQDMASDIATLFYTAQTGINFLSLVDGCDDGNVVSSYGGLTRSTYTGVKGTVTSSVGAITMGKLRTQFNAQTHGPKTPDLSVTTKTVWQYIEALTTPTMQLNIGQSEVSGYNQFTMTGKTAPRGADLKGAMGFSAIFFSGKPVVWDEVCTAGYLFMLNTSSWAFKAVESKHPDYKNVKFDSGTIDSVYSQVPVTTGFAFSGFNTPIDQYGRVGHILLMGNLLCDNPRLNGYMSGITS